MKIAALQRGLPFLLFPERVRQSTRKASGAYHTPVTIPTYAARIRREAMNMKPVLSPKAYDADRLRTWLQDRGIEAVIPGRATRAVVYPLNRTAYRRRNVIERMFGRLKNWKRIATR